MPHIIAKSAATGQYVPHDHPDAKLEEISGQLRQVIMRSVVTQASDDGPISHVHECIDYVPVEHVEQYAAEARTRWQEVMVGSDHDSGPGGDEQHLYADDHPSAIALTNQGA